MKTTTLPPGALGFYCKDCDKPVLLTPKDNGTEGKCSKCGRVFVSPKEAS